MEPEVKFHSIGIISDDIGEVNYPLPIDNNGNDLLLFTLKEGSRYQLKLTFSVLHNIVSGLTYSNTVWKAGLQGEESYLFCFHIRCFSYVPNMVTLVDIVQTYLHSINLILELNYRVAEFYIVCFDYCHWWNRILLSARVFPSKEAIKNPIS